MACTELRQRASLRIGLVSLMIMGGAVVGLAPPLSAAVPIAASVPCGISAPCPKGKIFVCRPTLIRVGPRFVMRPLCLCLKD